MSPDEYRNTITGMNFLATGFNYKADRDKAKAQKKWQRYSNIMTNFNNAMNQSVISQNEQMATSQAVQEKVNIQRGGMLTEAKVAVQAAAAGVKGRSSNQTLIDVQANVASRERTKEIELDNTLRGFAQSRKQSDMSTKMQQDYSFIPKPSASSYLLSSSMDMAKLWLQ